jgi:hypothetical protein
MNIIAFDPGKTTGWSRLWEGEFEAGELSWLDAVRYYHQLCNEKLVYFETVVESFIITAETMKKTRQNWSLESIGAMRYLNEIYHPGDFHLQSPAEAKAFATNDKLKKMGWYTVGQDHARDASRHLLVFAVKHKLIPLDKLI